MTSPSTSDQRAALIAVTGAATTALKRAWPSLRSRRPDVARDGLRQIVPALSDEFGSAASALALDIYAVLRSDAGVTGRFAPRPAAPTTVDDLNRMIGWAVDPLYAPEPKPNLTLYRVSGGLQKLVGDEYRDTMQEAAIEDPDADGWQRSARLDGCPFCVMLAARGAVYSETTVDFGAHRDCHCIAVPAFAGEEKPVKAYTPTSRNITAADRARVRRWIAQHH